MPTLSRNAGVYSPALQHTLQYPVFKLSTGVLIASCFLVINMSLWHDFPLHVPMLVRLRMTSHATCPDESTHE